jgi:hypothetical protein
MPQAASLVEAIREAVSSVASRSGRGNLIFRVQLPAKEGEDWNQVLRRRPSDPWPEDLAHCAETQMLTPLQEINDGAVVGVVPHREENVMTIAFALDDHVGTAP